VPRSAFPRFSVASPGELDRALALIDISVPPRTERTKEDCERWSACRFLATYARLSLLDYPLTVEHVDRPDLRLTMRGRQVGVEITEAIPTDWARADALRQHQDSEEAILLPRFLPGDAPRSLADIEAIAAGKAPGDGWEGDAAEADWADAMMHRIQDKAQSVTKPGFTRLGENGLLIYDNWPLPGVNIELAADKLAGQLDALTNPLPFDRIFIERGDQIVELVPGQQPIVRPVINLWADDVQTCGD
jgi:hypothetical protein